MESTQPPPASPVDLQTAELPGTPEVIDARQPLRLVHVNCCICDDDDVEPIGVGEDFEYRSCPDNFLALQCRKCGLVFLSPRPDVAELGQIYPPNYHAFDFSAEQFGLVYRVRRWLEAKRALSWCRGLPKDARILDVGCGDGFHLRLLADYGQPTWRLEGVDVSERAVAAAQKAGLTVHHGKLEELNLPPAAYDLIVLIQTIEHLEHPDRMLVNVRKLLRPQGKVIIVTDNCRSLDFWLFRGRHWGGYHFPRHWNLFNRDTIRILAKKVNLEVDRVATQVSPVNWVYSIRNLLVDWGAPPWLVRRFSLQAPVSLAVFTLLDNLLWACGRGALLRATFRRPAEGTS